MFIVRNIVISLFFIYALEKTKTIWWSVGAHFGLNAFLFDVVTTVEGQRNLAVVIIFVFLLYITCDNAMVKYFSKKVNNVNNRKIAELYKEFRKEQIYIP